MEEVKTIKEQMLDTISSMLKLEEMVGIEPVNNARERLIIDYIQRDRRAIEMSFVESECEWLCKEAMIDKVESDFDERAHNYVLEMAANLSL